MGEDAFPAPTFEADKILRCPIDILLRALNIVFGMALHKGMIEGRVIGDEVEHELQTSGLQSFSQPLKGFISAQRISRYIVFDGEARALNVFFSQIRPGFVKFFQPARMSAGDLSPARACLPDA